MELKWLEDFVVLANCASFSRAAEARHVTQSAFSRRIKQLETWLGVTLINRAGLPAELTAEGRAFLPVAQDTIRTFHQLRESLPPVADLGDRRVTIAALHSLGVTVLPEWLERSRATLPGLVTMVLPDRGGIEANLEALTGGEVDLFVTYVHPFVRLFLSPGDFEWKTLGAEQLLPVVSPKLRLPGLRAREDLIEQALRQDVPLPYLDYTGSSFFGVALHRVFAQRPPLQRKLVHQSTISDGLRQCALAGWGLCWLPHALIRDDLENGRLCLASRDPDWSLPVEIRAFRPRDGNRAMADALWRNLPTADPPSHPTQI
ncbi:LysR family transcriptional regulator [Paenirhodobacter sp.]|uniref:LysR family transcriptional regulator n=1 Tax=Paenirhodobacter sp. TaxID=1965326 RepID=UPI003B40612B